jgi:hypothetical protein
MQDCRTISISIKRNWQAVYEAIWRPEDFPKWASGLSRSRLEKHGEEWKAEGAEGPITIRFAQHNAFGVMDHDVHLSDGSIVYVPLRVIQNGEGAEVMLTLFRQPGMSEAKFAEDEAWVKRDLVALAALFPREDSAA